MLKCSGFSIAISNSVFLSECFHASSKVWVDLLSEEFRHPSKEIFQDRHFCSKAYPFCIRLSGKHFHGSNTESGFMQEISQSLLLPNITILGYFQTKFQAKTHNSEELVFFEHGHTNSQILADRKLPGSCTDHTKTNREPWRLACYYKSWTSAPEKIPELEQNFPFFSFPVYSVWWNGAVPPVPFFWF